jgi:hypothetical protein
MSQNLKQDILNNAFDYLMSAAEYVQKGTNRDFKYALLHLDAGIELLFKTMLQVEHWSLVFQNIDKIKRDSFMTGDFKSVDYETSICRLDNIIGIEIKEEDKKYLRLLRKHRNCVQHFSMDININEIKSLVGKGYNFVLDFYSLNLSNLNLIENENDYLERIHSTLWDFNEFIKQRFSLIGEELKRAVELIECQRCGQETLIIGIGEPYCPFCNFKIDALSLAKILTEENTGEEVLRCPKCGARTCAITNVSCFGIDFYCTSCGKSGDYHFCSSCNNPVDEEDEFCSDCIENHFSDEPYATKG